MRSHFSFLLYPSELLFLGLLFALQVLSDKSNKLSRTDLSTRKIIILL